MKESHEQLIPNNQNEVQILIGENREIKDKKRLINIFNRLKQDLENDNKKSITDVLENYQSNEEKSNKKDIKKINRLLKFFVFDIYLVLLCAINIGGFHIIILIYNTLGSFIWESILFYIG